MATFTAQNYGARAYGRIRTGVFQTCLMSVGFALAIGLVNVLFGRHLIRLFVGPGEDERRVAIHLTPAGRELSRKAGAIPQRLAQAAGLTAEELDQLRHTLGRLTAALHDAH